LCSPAHPLGFIVIVALVVLTGVTGAHTSGPSDRTVLRRAGEYVRRLANELPRMVVTERVVQQGDSLRPMLGRTERRWAAELGWVTVEGNAAVIGVRDVLDVDGQPVTDDRARLERLLHQTERLSWSDTRALLEEGAQYNLVPGSRNFNLPTVAVLFLLPDMQSRFSWHRRGRPDGAVWHAEFRERERPTLIRRGDGKPVFSRGEVWLDPLTGAVQRTELVLHEKDIDYTLTTVFDRVPEIGLSLPATMTERFVGADAIVTGKASYSNYRRFTTNARLVQ
jgi:hypothetical protein